MQRTQEQTFKKKENKLCLCEKKDTVKQALNGYENEMTKSRYETIVKATKNVIIHRQIRSRVKQRCNDQQGCKNEELLKSMMDSLLTKVQRSCVNEKYVVKALQFQLKSQTMKNPFDIINSRRAFVMFEALDDVLNQKQKHGFSKLSATHICW